LSLLKAAQGKPMVGQSSLHDQELKIPLLSLDGGIEEWREF